jgi:Tfp pilus assembly protein PilF
MSNWDYFIAKTKEAVQRLEQALKNDPEYAEAHYLLAGAYRKLGQEEKAAESLRKFQTLSSEARNTVAEELKGEEHYTAGIDFFRQNEMDRAYASFSKTVEALPNKHLAYYHLAVIDLSRGDFGSAQHWIRRAVVLYPWKSEYHFVLARCLQSDSPASATEAVKKAISLDPTEAEYHNLLGNLLLGQEDYHGAIKAYREAIAVGPDHPFFHLNLSTALREIGELEKAARETNRYRELVTQSKQNR